MTVLETQIAGIMHTSEAHVLDLRAGKVGSDNAHVLDTRDVDNMSALGTRDINDAPVLESMMGARSSDNARMMEARGVNHTRMADLRGNDPPGSDMHTIDLRAYKALAADRPHAGVLGAALLHTLSKGT